MASKGRGRPEPAMTIARSVAEVLDQHVTLELECIDRMYLNLYVPILQAEARCRVVLPPSQGPPVRLLGADGTDESRLCRAHGGIRRARRHRPHHLPPRRAKGGRGPALPR